MKTDFRFLPLRNLKEFITSLADRLEVGIHEVCRAILFYMKKRGITINTDASFCPETKAGAYAFYIVCDLFKIKKAGVFKVNPENPQDAEMKCIANALVTLNAQKELPEISWIIINSDCKRCFDLITLKSQSKTGRFCARELKKLRLRTKVQMHEFRHVKAHSGKNDARSFVNEWCDTEAKRFMRIKRTELLKP